MKTKQSATAYARARRARREPGETKGIRRLAIRLASWKAMTSGSHAADPTAYHRPGSVK